MDRILISTKHIIRISLHSNIAVLLLVKTYRIVGKFGTKFNLGDCWILAKPPNLIPPITQHLYIKQGHSQDI